MSSLLRYFCVTSIQSLQWVPKCHKLSLTGATWNVFTLSTDFLQSKGSWKPLELQKPPEEAVSRNILVFGDLILNFRLSKAPWTKKMAKMSNEVEKSVKFLILARIKDSWKAVGPRKPCNEWPCRLFTHLLCHTRFRKALKTRKSFTNGPYCMKL